MYWCGSSTPSGDQELIRSKWLSLDNHIHNTHEHEGVYNKCEHGPIQQRKKWFKRRKNLLFMWYLSYFIIDTKPSEELSKLITGTRFCNDVSRISPYYQTSALEAFHSVFIHFAPKSTAFSYEGMLGRYYTCMHSCQLICLTVDICLTLLCMYVYVCVCTCTCPFVFMHVHKNHESWKSILYT